MATSLDTSLDTGALGIQVAGAEAQRLSIDPRVDCV